MGLSGAVTKVRLDKYSPVAIFQWKRIFLAGSHSSLPAKPEANIPHSKIASSIDKDAIALQGEVICKIGYTNSSLGLTDHAGSSFPTATL